MTTQNKNIVSTHTLNIEGNEVTAYRIYNDTNGNPRYVIHFLDINIKMEDYGNIKGLTKFRQAWFGGGYVFQSYAIEEDVKHALKLVNLFYNPYAKYTNEEQYTKMERLAKRIERKTSLGLASAFMSGSYYGHDSFAMIANSKAYEHEGGYVVFNKFTNKAEFIKGE